MFSEPECELIECVMGETDDADILRALLGHAIRRSRADRPVPGPSPDPHPDTVRLDYVTTRRLGLIENGNNKWFANARYSQSEMSSNPRSAIDSAIEKGL